MANPYAPETVHSPTPEQLIDSPHDEFELADEEPFVEKAEVVPKRVESSESEESIASS